MMKSLLVTVSSLVVFSAAAQLNATAPDVSWQPMRVSSVKTGVETREMQMRSQGEMLPSPSRSSVPVKPFYRRPAGAFSSIFMAEGDVWSQMLRNILLVKPYSNYTYSSSVPGADENDRVYWVDQYIDGVGPNLIVNYGCDIYEPPTLYVNQPDINRQAAFQYPYYFDLSGWVVSGNEPGRIFAVPSLQDVGYDEGCELLLSSKTMCPGGRNGDLTNLFKSYTGPEPFGTNTDGRWFGKNGGHFDGLAQAFEAPEHPYLLKSVGIVMGNLSCVSPVDLTCKVYRIDDIPDYQDGKSVELSTDSWELIATGRATVTPETDSSPLVTFILYDHEEDDPSLEYEVTPTIDDAILVVFEGYNDPSADGLRDFTCFISADFHSDEGYGELAYIKRPINDEAGNFTGQYRWVGLNGFFRNENEMKTGYSIFIVADMPYLAFNNNTEAGEYFFPFDGEAKEIEFKAYTPSCDDEWTITCRGEEIPEWLEIELVDGVEYGEFNNIVTARVTASPLPPGLKYREAVVRFEIPGAYQDYRFIQGINVIPPYPCGPPDGEITIADVNCLIHLILVGKYDECVDVNSDGEITIADVNALIDYILAP